MHPLGWVALFPSIGAYVGADIVAGSSRPAPCDRRPGLLVDARTNGEIVAGTRSAAWRRPRPPARRSRAARSCTACATDGAIEGSRSQAAGSSLQVIGGDDAEPRGICGSGLIDVVAQLRLAGLLDDGGKMMSRRRPRTPATRSPITS